MVWYGMNQAINDDTIRQVFQSNCAQQHPLMDGMDTCGQSDAVWKDYRKEFKGDFDKKWHSHKRFQLNVIYCRVGVSKILEALAAR
jgi:hypothetical protein